MWGGGKASPNEAPKKPQTYMAKLLTRCLKYTSHLLALSTSPDHGDGGGALHLWKTVHVGCYQHLLNMGIWAN